MILKYIFILPGSNVHSSLPSTLFGLNHPLVTPPLPHRLPLGLLMMHVFIHKKNVSGLLEIWGPHCVIYSGFSTQKI